jgi:hypothetical protein
MFAAIRRLKFKIKLALYLTVLVIVSLLAFGIYAKVRGIQSVNFIEDQSESTSEMAELMRDIADSLNGIEIQLCEQGENPEDCSLQ